jgi:surface antigen
MPSCDAGLILHSGMSLLNESYQIRGLYQANLASDHCFREASTMKVKTLFAAAVISVTAAACAQNGQLGTKQTIGALGGAALGGWAGSTIGHGKGQLAATAAGALIGALVGSEIGRSMDDVDRMKAQHAYTQATTAPVGQSINWNNPNTGNSGTVTPTRDGTSSGGEYCREFQQTVMIGGRQEQAFGVACRRPDGSWEVR